MVFLFDLALDFLFWLVTLLVPKLVGKQEPLHARLMSDPFYGPLPR